MFGSIAKAVASVGAKIGAKWLEGAQNKSNAKSLTDYQAKTNKALTKWNYLYGPKYQLQGLKDAGMNPVLYASDGVGAAPSVSLGSAAAPDYEDALNDAMNERINSARAESEVKLADAQMENIKNDMYFRAESNKRQEMLAQEQAKLLRSQTLYNNANAAKAVADSLGTVMNPKLFPIVKAVSKAFNFDFSNLGLNDAHNAASLPESNSPVSVPAEKVKHISQVKPTSSLRNYALSHFTDQEIHQWLTDRDKENPLWRNVEFEWQLRRARRKRIHPGYEWRWADNFYNDTF